MTLPAATRPGGIRRHRTGQEAVRTLRKERQALPKVLLLCQNVYG